jgi:hypothetical protein
MAEWKEQSIGHDHSRNVLSCYVYENKQRGWDIQTKKKHKKKTALDNTTNCTVTKLRHHTVNYAKHTTTAPQHTTNYATYNTIP